MSEEAPAEERIEKALQKLSRDAQSGGYHLNPDREFTKDLIAGLLVNEDRYGYWACPCRLASGKKEEDLDIICPCDYRDPDLGAFHMCYCALYVSEKVIRKEVVLEGSIPERRPPGGKRDKQIPGGALLPGKLAYPVWRCKVCGYLCAREEPPETCPVCKVKKERFERFL
ncbi:MAG: ferredoxin-thioredoxin reductase catalytic domain-containing protein [Candidatus Eremiobacteraeota bacterium]|nr:ferredoxin-thioredoxin reductase catalytic domain-containing protein [Candidatus Eremiobacteraeota bacterium]